MPRAFDHAAYDGDAFWDDTANPTETWVKAASETEPWTNKATTKEIWEEIPPPERRAVRPADES
jgi:hypothetical protein